MENVAFLKGRKSAAILDEQGLGKSCSVIAYLDELQATKGTPLRALVVCPSTIMQTWAGEVRKFARALEPCVVAGSRAKRLRLLGSTFASNDGKGVVFIVNYEFVRALRKTASNVAKMRPPFHVVIADEMTRIKNRMSQTARSLHDFVRHSPSSIRIGMTGTPITQSPLDAYSQFLFVDPSVFGTRYPEFESRYATTRQADYGNGSFKQVTGYRNLGELTQRIHKVSIRHDKSTCTDLPAKTHQRIILDFDKEQRRVYDELRQDMIAEVSGSVVTAANALARLSKLQQITSGFVYDTSNPDKKITKLVSKTNPKTAAMLDIIADAAGPVVVWCRFRADLDIVSAALSKAKVNHRVFRSDLSPDELSSVTDEFQAGGFPVLVAQTEIAQFGLTWTAASTAIFYSTSWSVEQLLQAQDRIHRIGQTRPCLYYYLTIAGSVDDACYAALHSKARVGKAIAAADLQALSAGELIV